MSQSTIAGPSGPYQQFDIENSAPNSSWMQSVKNFGSKMDRHLANGVSSFANGVNNGVTSACNHAVHHPRKSAAAAVTLAAVGGFGVGSGAASIYESIYDRGVSHGLKTATQRFSRDFLPSHLKNLEISDYNKQAVFSIDNGNDAYPKVDESIYEQKPCRDGKVQVEAVPGGCLSFPDMITNVASQIKNNSQIVQNSLNDTIEVNSFWGPLIDISSPNQCKEKLNATLAENAGLNAALAQCQLNNTVNEFSLMNCQNELLKCINSSSPFPLSSNMNNTSKAECL